MSQPMGIGKLGEANMLFVREFRFILKGKYLKESFVKSVDVDYFNKVLVISIYEVYENLEGEINAHIWADGVHDGKYGDEELKLTTYDGYGKEIYSYIFKEINVIGRRNKFDYASSEAVCHQISVSYERLDKVKTNETTTPTKAKEEAWVHHLNAKMGI